jgi:hypothetical protein
MGPNRKSQFKMKTKILIAFILAILILASSSPAGLLPSARSDFKVIITAVDDVGAPALGADIGFSWGRIGGPKPDTDSVRKIADRTGVVEFTGATKYDEYAYGANKKGYYPTRGIDGQFTNSVSGHWQPWPQTYTVILKPIKKPAPMFARQLTCDIPTTNAWVGFDLERGDWVAPHGKGTHADFEFFAEGTVEDFRLNYHGKLTMRLPRDANGIQAYDYQAADLNSVLKMPYEAPTNGYTPSWTWHNSRTTENKPFATSKFVDESYPNRGFIFRVRTVLDAQGKVVQANYGKIHGPFIFDPRGDTGRCYISFNYYFNPESNSRNLEFDPKHNLFMNLKPDERVYDP